MTTWCFDTREGEKERRSRAALSFSPLDPSHPLQAGSHDPGKKVRKRVDTTQNPLSF
jgi:hypothetical protein